MADFITDRNNEKKLLRVFTLNCWSIPYFSENRKSRITAIAEYLSTSNLDIVCLQEVWSKKDYLFISKKCYTQLPYSHYFNSFIYGSGLCILSKYPITDVYFHQWAINGYPHKILQGDWFAGKGLAFSKIVMNDFIIHIYNAHLHAEYNANSVDYLSHRVLQALDTSQFIKFTTEDCDLAILAGDLNTEPNELPMKILNQNAQLADCFYTAQEKCSSAFGTNESERNSYSPKAKVKNHPEGKRIDYVLYRNSKRLNVDVTQYNFPLPEYVPGCKHSYSDHEAIEVVFQCIVDSGLKAKTPEIDAFELQTTLETSIEICNEALNKLQNYSSTFPWISEWHM
ncbi:hypothetical protein RUM43_006714 [Polyplax serrata]|uniref:sphingomyelin phosphodiesterase n=1 Tax=Polyplax serrata TaxID=468196 RepID=A0AAN8NTS7_POLSC